MIEHSFQHYLLGLFAVANNFSAIGLFLSICEGLSRKEQLRLALISTITAFLTMTITLLTGHLILAFFEISVDAFRIAGGVLLGVSGMQMLNSKMLDQETHQKNDLSKVIPVAIVPIGIPLTTGAGTISTVILFSGKFTNWAINVPLFSAIVAMTIVIYLVFRFSTQLLNLLGKLGMLVLIKIMGLFTLAIGVQFILSGLSSVFPGLLSGKG